MRQVTHRRSDAFEEFHLGVRLRSLPPTLLSPCFAKECVDESARRPRLGVFAGQAGRDDEPCPVSSCPVPIKRLSQNPVPLLRLYRTVLFSTNGFLIWRGTFKKSEDRGEWEALGPIVRLRASSSSTSGCRVIHALGERGKESAYRNRLIRALFFLRRWGRHPGRG
jgi:hypothetical protein